MKVAVTDKGLLIPKDLLIDVEEVEVKKENNLIIISPTKTADPIFGLGQHPVSCSIPDASENLDKYLYGSDKQ